jgi:xanthine/uracil permease
MSSDARFYSIMTVTLFLAGFAGWLTQFFMDPGLLRILTSFVIGSIIGKIGWDIAHETEDKV